MTERDPSRRNFLKGAASGVAGALLGAAQGTGGGSETSGQANFDDLTRLRIAEASDLIRRKKLSPIELTRACLARIDRLNPTLNCFITVTADKALLQAQEAESEIQRGKWRGPHTVFQLP
jgi:hypothetical protein